MSIVKFNRFTRPGLLQGIRRDLLDEFFSQFTSGLRQCGLELPRGESDDGLYCRTIADMLSRPETLPPGLIEALVAIEEMSGADGRDRLEAAAAQEGLTAADANGSTRADLALQLWLANPALLARKHNEQRLQRLTVFEHFAPAPGCLSGGGEAETRDLRSLAAELDDWFQRNWRGRNTTRVERHSLNNEIWFPVRHGDTFTRAPRVEEQRTEILHFRPERDDAIVYCPRTGRLRLNARTRGERELYARAFGRWLHGDANWFSNRFVFTLAPLRELGPESLDPRGLEQIERITLRAVKLVSDPVRGAAVTQEGADLFRGGIGESWDWRGMPATWRLVSASFDFLVRGDQKSRPVQVRLPNVLKVGRHAEATLVLEWMRRVGLILS